MRPEKMTEAHQTGDVAELVCSNSLKSDEPENAHGLLKAELRVLGSALLECAERARVPGGKALVVDRRRFSAEVQSELSRAGVDIERAEVISLPPAAAWYRSRVELSDPHQPTVDLGKLGTVPQAENRGQSPRGSRRTLAGTVPVFGPLGAGQSPFSSHPASTTIAVVATGPLTSSPMADALQALLGTEHLFFYDAIAPIVAADSLDTSRVFEGSRYGAGSDYLNCPMSEEEYDRLVDALLGAELHPLHPFERNGKQGTDPQAENRGQSPGGSRRTLAGTVPVFGPLGAVQSPSSSCPAPQFFEGCLPVEEIARRGRLALAFGPMKPVGLVDPRTGKRPFAVVQLRRENVEGTMYNMVGFQTRLKQGEQERVFRMIPGLERAKFLRFGSIHRNTFLDSPKVLLPTLQTSARPDLLVAGQLTGVEGYVESIGAGIVAGINAARLAREEEPVELPLDMMLGSLLLYISGGFSPVLGTVPIRGQSPHFQPMNANFGLLPAISGDSPQRDSPRKRLRGRDKRRALAERALEAARGFALTLVENRA
jgi:methylenetetrahydrofolate--tRNA-(uracil-5-)-methyltransferase